MKDSIYIVAGGPSLKGFDFSKLKDINTIAVNSSGLDVPDPTFCITADSGMFRKIQNGIFDGIKTTKVMIAHPQHCTMKFIKGQYKHIRNGHIYNPFCVDMLIKNKGCEGIGFTFDDFRTGFNSGFCALQLAVLLGYKKIYLLGIDLNTDKGPQHYHNYYKGKRTTDDSGMDRYFRNFKVALDILKKKKIKVISCSKTSRLNSVISYKPFNETTK